MENYLDVESSSMHGRENDTTLIVTEDFDIVQTQRRLLSVLKKILGSESEAFRVTQSGSYNRMGYLLKEAIGGLTLLESSISKYQQLHPTIRLFNSILKTYNLTEAAT